VHRTALAAGPQGRLSSVLTWLSRRTRIVRTKVVRIVAIKQVLPQDEAVWADDDDQRRSRRSLDRLGPCFCPVRGGHGREEQDTKHNQQYCPLHGCSLLRWFALPFRWSEAPCDCSVIDPDQSRRSPGRLFGSSAEPTLEMIGREVRLGITKQIASAGTDVLFGQTVNASSCPASRSIASRIHMATRLASIRIAGQRPRDDRP
jgi:hypothetical protein